MLVTTHSLVDLEAIIRILQRLYQSPPSSPPHTPQSDEKSVACSDRIRRTDTNNQTNPKNSITMHFSKLILLATAAVASAQQYDAPASTPTPSGSVLTITNTRTVQRVATVTSTHASTGTGMAYATANATAVQTAKVSPTSSSGTIASNGAAENSINIALVALTGVATFFLL